MARTRKPRAVSPVTERRRARRAAREVCKAEQKRVKGWVPAERKRVAGLIVQMRAHAEQQIVRARAELAELIKNEREGLRKRIAAARKAASLGKCVDTSAGPVLRFFGPKAPPELKRTRSSARKAKRASSRPPAARRSSTPPAPAPARASSRPPAARASTPPPDGAYVVVRDEHGKVIDSGTVFTGSVRHGVQNYRTERLVGTRFSTARVYPITALEVAKRPGRGKSAAELELGDGARALLGMPPKARKGPNDADYMPPPAKPKKRKLAGVDRRRTKLDPIATFGTNQKPRLEKWAAEVLKVARGADVAKFHKDRAFIASVYDHLPRAKRTVIGGGTLEAFKDDLIWAHRERLLRLSRADLVQAMDPKLVARSETTYLSAQFHFVALDNAKG